MPRKSSFYRLPTRTQRHHHAKRIKKAAKHPFVVPVVTVILLLGLTLSGFWLTYNRRTDKHINPNVVLISHDHKQQIVSSKESTVGKLLAKLAITINEGDVVEPALTTAIQQDNFRINIYRAVPVQILDSSSKTFALSAATTPRSIATQAGLEVFPEDTITTVPVTDFVGSGSVGTQVVIDRATPVNINLYGAAVVLRTHASTVRALLAEKKISLKAEDIVKPGLDTALTPLAKVAVIRNGIATVTQQEIVPAPIQRSSDNTLAYGTTAIRQQGTPGKRAVTYEINTQNGVEVSRKVVSSVVIQAAVPQIEVAGSNLSGIKGDMALAGISPDDYTYADYIISHESGWCPTKAQGQYGGCPAYSGSVSASGGYGLCQSTPGSKMASAGSDWATNPVTQLKWCAGYAIGRYGSWGAAYNHWVSYHNW